MRENIFGDVIFRYTRAEAIADGVLVDLGALCPDVCRQHYKHPIACTAVVWAMIEETAAIPGHDVLGAVSDILWMSRRAQTEAPDESTRLFRVLLGDPENPEELEMCCGPGDHLEPVLTIMLPHED
jgi:hypothetical protein